MKIDFGAMHVLPFTVTFMINDLYSVDYIIINCLTLAYIHNIDIFVAVLGAKM